MMALIEGLSSMIDRTGIGPPTSRWRHEPFAGGPLKEVV